MAGVGEKGDDPSNAVEIVRKRYEGNETDEFLKPIVFADEARIKGNLEL